MFDQSTTPSLRFGLRTLFVVVTLVAIPCAWVGYSLNWIRQRQEAMNRSAAGHVLAASTNIHRLKAPTAPGGLWLFGESGIAEIVTSETNIERLSVLFPEASVIGMSEWQELNRALSKQEFLLHLPPEMQN